MVIQACMNHSFWFVLRGLALYLILNEKRCDRAGKETGSCVGEQQLTLVHVTERRLAVRLCSLGGDACDFLSPPLRLCVLQNSHVKKAGSLEKLKGIAWGRSGNRVRSRPDNGDGWLSVENQVR